MIYLMEQECLSRTCNRLVCLFLPRRPTCALWTLTITVSKPLKTSHCFQTRSSWSRSWVRCCCVSGSLHRAARPPSPPPPPRAWAAWCWRIWWRTEGTGTSEARSWRCWRGCRLWRGGAEEEKCQMERRRWETCLRRRRRIWRPPSWTFSWGRCSPDALQPCLAGTRTLSSTALLIWTPGWATERERWALTRYGSNKTALFVPILLFCAFEILL